MELSEGSEDWVEINSLASGKISYTDFGVSYLVMKYPESDDSLYPSAVFNAEVISVVNQ